MAGALELLLGLLAVGDVEDDAVHGFGPARLVVLGRAERIDPALLAARQQDAIFDAARLFRKMLELRADDLLPVLGMDVLLELAGIGELVGVEAEQVAGAVGEAGRSGRGIERPDSELGALDRQLELVARGLELVLGLHPVGDVDEDAVDRLDLFIVVARGGAEAVDPADLAVGADDPIFAGDRAFGEIVVAVEDEAVAVVGMDALPERLAVGQEILADADDLAGAVGIPGDAGARVVRPDAELGAGHGELELVAHLLELFFLRCVPGPVADGRREEAPALHLDLEHGELDRDDPAVLAERLGLHALAENLGRAAGHVGGEAVLVGGAQMLGHDQLADRPADRLGGAVAEHRFGRGIHRQDAAGLVDHDHSVECRGDGSRLDGLELSPLKHANFPHLGQGRAHVPKRA